MEKLEQKQNDSKPRTLVSLVIIEFRIQRGLLPIALMFRKWLVLFLTTLTSHWAELEQMTLNIIPRLSIRVECNVISFVRTAFLKASEDREWLWLWSRERLDRCFLQASCFKQYPAFPAECNQTWSWVFTLLITNSHGRLWHGLTCYKYPMSCEADSSCHPWDSPFAQISWLCRKGGDRHIVSGKFTHFKVES